jgi:high-affinity Fe2+/Pb2+ permease
MIIIIIMMMMMMILYLSSHRLFSSFFMDRCRLFTVTGKLVLSDDEQEGLASLAYAAGMRS